MMTLDELCGHSLLLDLETRPDGKIFKIGAVFYRQLLKTDAWEVPVLEVVWVE